MPRRRKAARAFRQSRGDAHERVKNYFKNPFAELDFCNVEKWHDLFPTVAERQALCELFPHRFFHACGFEASVFDRYPSSVVHMGGACVFRRENFLQWLEAHPAAAPFDPPDLRGVPYREREMTLARARAAWWKANDWPCDNDPERYWLAFGTPRPPEWDAEGPAKKILPMTVN